MASPFPQRKSQGAGGMTAPGVGGGMLDGPPPSPVMQGAGPVVPGAAPAAPSFSDMAAPMAPGTLDRALTPELVSGLLMSAASISKMFDSMATIAPDLANDFALIQDLLQRTLGKLVVNGGTAAAPGSTGLNFPGGGFLSGTM